MVSKQSQEALVSPCIDLIYSPACVLLTTLYDIREIGSLEELSWLRKRSKRLTKIQLRKSECLSCLKFLWANRLPSPMMKSTWWDKQNDRNKVHLWHTSAYEFLQANEDIWKDAMRTSASPILRTSSRSAPFVGLCMSAVWIASQPWISAIAFSGKSLVEHKGAKWGWTAFAVVGCSVPIDVQMPDVGSTISPDVMCPKETRKIHAWKVQNFLSSFCVWDSYWYWESSSMKCPSSWVPRINRPMLWADV